MKYIFFCLQLIILGMISSSALANYVSIPATSFVGFEVSYNETGTAAFIRKQAFAPVHLPHGSKAQRFSCGVKAWPIKGFRISLRRNEPQQENIDMGAVNIDRGSNGGFKFLSSEVLIENGIDNRRYNYYLTVEIQPKSETTGSICNGKECIIGSCQIHFTQ